MSGVVVETCAKVNYCVRVLGRRPDGYHSVETILQTIGLRDRIRLTPTEEDRAITVSVDATDVPTDETNLCWRAASLLMEHTKVSRGVSISLEKSIPVGAGLGGGSSDAAATLIGLMRLWELSVSQNELEGLAAQLGADVPFFLRGGCCLARGMGEKLKALPEAPAWLVVVVPERRVSTAQAYAALRRGATRGRRRELSRPIRRTIEALKEGTLEALAGALHDDFEAAPMNGIEEAMRAKADLLEAGCLGAALSGSGSGTFGIAPNREAAEQMAARLRASWEWVRVAPTVPAGEGIVVTGGNEEASG